MTRLRAEIADERPRSLRHEIERAESDIAYYGGELATIRAAKAQIEENIAVLREVVNNSPDDDVLLTELQRLIGHPAVLGTRTDGAGRLFVQFRVMHTEEDKVYDLGDYELGFANQSGEGEAYTLNFIRIPEMMMGRWSFGGYYPQLQNGIYVGRVTLSNFHFHLGRFVEMLEQTIEQVVEKVKADTYYYGFSQLQFDGQVPEQIWEGTVSNLLKAYKRSKEQLYMPRPATQLSDAERNLQHYEQQIRSKLETIRRLQRSVREKRAELRNLDLRLKQNTPAADREQAHGDYEYIKSLPGVMGIRFGRDGTPIIHVRMSHVYRGMRFDLGDVEVYLTEEGRNESYSVVKIRATRWYGYGGPYLSSAGTGRDWFCFGTRAGELRELFRKGAIREFLHLAINSLNSLNPEHRSVSFLREIYKEIPMDAVWVDQPKEKRRRRRFRRVQQETPETVAV